MFFPLIRRYLEKLPLHVKGALRKITKSGSTGRPSLQPWVSRCARGTPHTVRETTKAGEWGRFPFNKNSGLKFQKFHMPNGTVPSGCTDPTQATTRLVIFISMIQKKRYWDNNFVKWKGTFRSDLPKWPDRSKLTMHFQSTEYSRWTKPKWSVPFDVPTKVSGILGRTESALSLGDEQFRLNWLLFWPLRLGTKISRHLFQGNFQGRN